MKIFDLPRRLQDSVAAQLYPSPGMPRKAEKPAPGAVSSDSGATATLAIWRACGIPDPVLEYKFHPVRKWRADYAFPDHKVLVEVEGGAWIQGRHTRGSGFLKDCEKYNAAARMGWRLLRFQPSELTATSTIATIKETLGL